MSYSEAGKGSAPRKNQDNNAYSNGWDRIFGNKNGQTKTTEKDSAKSEKSGEKGETS